MGAVWTGLTRLSWGFTEKHAVDAEEGAVLDLLYIGITMIVFTALWLLVKGVERLER